jgi:pyruvate, water dikinase
MNHDRPVRRLSELGAGDVAIAGGKGANLGELIRAGLPVPPGFVITVPAYRRTVQHAGLRADLERSAAGPDRIAAALSERILSERILDVDLPDEVAEPVLAAYRELGEPAVAVRSSATGEDGSQASFAGIHATFTNVRGRSELLTCVKECWASAYGPRARSYRSSRRITAEPAIAVVVQTMVRSERSGVIFTADPRTGDRDRVVLEAAFGLGEVVAAGQLVPDTYVLDRHGPRLLEVRIGHKDHKIVTAADGHEVHVDLPIIEATRRVLGDDEALALARLALRAQEHFGCPQDVEWAVQDGVTYLLQSRPITTPAGEPEPGDGVEVHGRLVGGLGAAAGIACGLVRILVNPEHAGTFRDGEILVAPTISPDWMPVLQRAAAIVTDGGGITCHAAIVSRELGIPAIVGTGSGTRVLYDGQRVRVDGLRGVVEEATPAEFHARPRTGPAATHR